MTTIDTGTYGAKRQSYRKASPRDLLKRLMEENAKASESKLQLIFADAARNDPEMIDAIIEYWFANNFRSLIHNQPRVKEAAATERVKRVAEIKDEIRVAAARMVLLEMSLPNGKMLRDSTGKECAKAGGWFSRIARAIKPTQKVGAVLSEEEVRKFWRA